MAKKDRIYMPTGTGGLIRYGEEGKVKINLKPRDLVYVTIAIVVFELVLKFLFA